MNKQEMAEYIVAIFQNCEAYYKEHLTDFGNILPHVFASEAINDPMKTEFEVNAQSEIFNKYCRLIQHLWKSGDEEVRNVVDVTILESISDNSLMWEAFDENISLEFKQYINEELLRENIVMSHVDRLKGKTDEVAPYSEKEIQIVKSGTDAVKSVLLGNDTNAKRRLLCCLDWFMDSYYGNDIFIVKDDLKNILETVVISANEDDVIDDAISLLEYTDWPYPILETHFSEVSERIKPMVRYLLNHELNKGIEFLYNRSWDEELSEDDQYKLEDYAKKIIKEYGWVKVYDAVCNYLYTHCTNPESVINFAHLYWIYGWHEYPISKPYEFLGYFYFRIDMDTVRYDEMDILDSLAVSILPKSGYEEANLYHNPNYLPETDSMLLAAVEAYKNHK